MFCSRQSTIAGALTGALLVLSACDVATAAPISFAGPAVVAPQTMITDVRARARVRRHYRGRSGVGPSAILGMFGAVMGAAALANSYDNYSNYSYGGLNNYGYSPGYGGCYGGRGGFGGGRGGHAGGRRPCRRRTRWPSLRRPINGRGAPEEFRVQRGDDNGL